MSTSTITAVTGINGAGKTVFLLPHVEKLHQESKKELNEDGTPRWPSGRPVYYWAIPGIKEKGVLSHWKEISTFEREGERSKLEKPEIVHQIEDGAIIVIDEAHRAFGRLNGKEVPPHIENFDMSRHRGHSFFLCTQRAADLHPFVRGRIGRHFHLKRVFGMERSTLFDWEQVGDPESTKSKELAQVSEFPFPKEVYGWYKSADSHTIQAKFPWRLAYQLGGAVAVAIVAGFVSWHYLHKTPDPPPGAVQAVPATVAQPEHTSKKADLLKTLSQPKEQAPAWATTLVERVQGQPMSPEFYDTVWRPVALPKIAGCARIQYRDVDKCVCNTQQGTIITTITHAMCVHYLANGWFDPTRQDVVESSAKLDEPPEPSPVASPGVSGAQPLQATGVSGPPKASPG